MGESFDTTLLALQSLLKNKHSQERGKMIVFIRVLSKLKLTNNEKSGYIILHKYGYCLEQNFHK